MLRGLERERRQLQTFCHRVSEGLDRMSFEERQELLRLVVDRITVEDESVRIKTVIPQGDDYSQLRTRHAEPVEGLHVETLPRQATWFDGLTMSELI